MNVLEALLVFPEFPTSKVPASSCLRFQSPISRNCEIITMLKIYPDPFTHTYFRINLQKGGDWLSRAVFQLIQSAEEVAVLAANHKKVLYCKKKLVDGAMKFKEKIFIA